MIKITHEGKEQVILTVQDGMTWSGSKDQGPRDLTFDFLYKPINDDIPKYNVAVGDGIIWEENNKILFQGYIETLDYSTDNNTISVTCKDFMARLMRSKFIGRMKGTLNQLANKICGAFNLQNGINVNNPHVNNIVSNGDLTYFQVLEEACKALPGRNTLYLDGTTLKLSEHESQGTFKIGKNIRSSSFNQDMSNIVTRVLIIDNNGKVLNAVEDTESLKKFGLFQETYNYNKDSKNNLADARKLLKTTENKATIVCDNDNKCISGRFIKVLEPAAGHIGFFEIKEDSHIIGADSSMTLKIKFVEGTSETENVEL